ncbi:MAG TPA: hypothetical protein VIU34_10190 [Steroidobacter sp.]
MQRLCHNPLRIILLTTGVLCASVTPVLGDSPVHDYPTQARVEFVNECIATHGDTLSSLYQCSCAIDRIADRLGYEEFVEASTFAKYSSLPGEGGGVFRDSEEAKKKGKLYREVEAQAFSACGVKKK